MQKNEDAWEELDQKVDLTTFMRKQYVRLIWQVRGDILMRINFF